MTDVVAVHRAGQTFVTWREIAPAPPASLTFAQYAALRRLLADERGIRYRIYRSAQPISTTTMAELVGEVGPLSAWNGGFLGVYPPDDGAVPRYRIDEAGEPLSPGTGVFVHNPASAGTSYYAVVTVSGSSSPAAPVSTRVPIQEAPGDGVPVLQGVVRPAQHQFIERPELHFYTRWEPARHASVPGTPHDYLVALPRNVRYPAPVGIHLHGWGGSMQDGYGWWFNGQQGAILVSSNEQPYDWWTGYHERFGRGRLDTQQDWQSGVVRPYTQRRLLAFVDYLATQIEIDPTRTFAAGNSMGGSGALMLAIRYPDRIAWAISWVGVHVPRKSPTFRSSYEGAYGQPEWNARFEDGTPAWDYFDDVWYLRRYPERSTGFITFSNGKNDRDIGWEQAVDFLRALQDTRQPHLFTWGQNGHGERAVMPAGGGEREMPLRLVVNQSLPAFTRSSLDDDPGTGDPATGAPAGQVNQFLAWRPESIVDRADEWSVEISVIDAARQDSGTVDVTPRRLQSFVLRPGDRVAWVNQRGGTVLQQGDVVADQWGLVTIPQVAVSKRGSVLRLKRSGG